MKYTWKHINKDLKQIVGLKLSTATLIISYLII